METSTSFGYWVRRRRKALDLTQQGLAQRAGCSVDAIKKIEADLRRPSRELAERLANHLAVPMDERQVFLQVARAELSPERLRLGHQPVSLVAPPSETVTLLLADIEDSAALWEQHPAAMPLVLSRYTRLLGQAVAAQGGRLYRAFDERVCAIFASAALALTAALHAQRSLCNEDWGDLPIPRVRTALHSGETPMRDGTPFLGRTYKWAACLLATGHGGQILLSRATVELAHDALLPGVALRDLGEHQLQSLSRPAQIFQLVASDLPAAFRPLRAADVRPTNLPAPPNLFVGRERQRAALRDLLRRPGVRLVSLTGPGGIGKTRLGLAVAEDLLADFPHGVWFVDLAPITNSSLFVPQVADALGVTESGSRPLTESLHAYLRDRRLLILLDNLEQVSDVATQVARLLAAAPGLTLLVTSRVPLHLSSEYERPVPPLTLPEKRAARDIGRLSQCEAMRLFVERAHAVSPTFALTAENAPVIAEICCRLDGLPLAIELAVTRLRSASPDALLSQLSSRLAALTDGPRDLPARQRTLRATIAWSFQLLDREAQRVFAYLAVFVGGCTAAAASAVCGGRAEAIAEGTMDVEALLHLLADSSLLCRSEDPSGSLRFTMLETIREYALEQLAASGAVAVARRRHTQYAVLLVEEAQRWLTGSKRSQWLDQLDAEYDNIQEALMRSAANADGGEALLRLSAGLWWYWYFRGKASEGRAWLDQALAQQGAAPTNHALLWARCGAGGLAWVQGDLTAAGVHLRASIAGWRELGDRRGLAYALTFHGLTLQYQFDLAGARVAHDESVAIFHSSQDRWGMALALASLADLCYFQRDVRQARQLYEESIGLARELADRWNLAWALSGLGFVAYEEGQHEQAEALFAESIALLQGEGSKLRLAATLNKQGNLLRLGGRIGEAADCYEASLALFRDLATQMVVAGPLHNLGFIALHRGDNRRAAALFAESIAVAQAQQDWGEVATGLGGLAAVAAVRGEAAQAARGFAALERLLAIVGEDLDPVNRAACDQYCAALRHTVSETLFASAWAEGEAAPPEEVVAEMLRALV